MMTPKTDVDPEDGLPLVEVGQWALEKHARLRPYLEISRAVRRKFIGPTNAGATFIDLYCGPGRARVRETGALIDGSPLIAFDAAREVPFSGIYLADLESSWCEAAVARLQARGGIAHKYVGPAGQTVARITPSSTPTHCISPFLTRSTLRHFRSMSFNRSVSSSGWIC